jgi:Ca2+-binding RTX toxin-like protein
VRLAPLLLATALLALPATAQAATVNSLGAEILYQGDLTERSDATVTIIEGGTQVDIVERGTSLQAGLGCSQVETPAGSDKKGQVRCSLESAEKITFDMRDSDDALTVAIGATPPAPPLSVLGGEGIDVVSYSPPAPATGVSVSLDGVANDGLPGRGDNIGADVETAVGTGSADVLTGNDSANRFFGSGGEDVYSGAGGRDLFETSEPGGAPARDRITCGAGRDTVDGDELDEADPDCEIVAVNSRIDLTNGRDVFKLFRSGLSVFGRGGNDVITGNAADVIDGGKGNDKLIGGSDVDRLTGGPGRDKLYGGAAGDTIRARDGKRDRVGCGPGQDVVQADRRDSVRPDCEKVTRRR